MTSGLVTQSEGTITAASSSFSMSTMGAMTLAGSSSATASTIPTGSEPEIAFISAVTSSATVAATSYGAWYAAGAHHDPTYDPTSSYATKWGSTTLSTSGTPGGDVTYWFDATSAWSASEQVAWVSGLALWSAETNITFTLAADAAAANFIIYRQPHEPGGDSGSAYTEFPNQVLSTIGSSVEGVPGSDGYVAIDTTVAGFGPIGDPFATYGGYPYDTVVHELGHVLGLGHAGPYNFQVDAATQQFSAYDMRLWSIMSYIDPWQGHAKYYDSYPVTGTEWGFAPDGSHYVPTTPMILDILAAQRLYGPPTSGPLSGGGQVFGFNTNITGPIAAFFDFTVNTHPVITIWDGGTNNTLDLSGWSTPSTINLNAGTFSSADGAVNNIAIAVDTIIETGIGGGGNDTITGNPYNNVLNGGASADLMAGGAGNDAYFVDNVSDAVVESANDGIDTVYSTAHFRLSANVENLVLQAGADLQAYGNILTNVLYGNAGNNLLDGDAGADAMYGGAGSDVYFVDNVGDAVIENSSEGNDTVFSTAHFGLSANVENLVLQASADLQGYGNSLSNAIYGNTGNNLLDGGAGADAMTGGAGNDVYFVDNVGDAVVENSGEGNDAVFSTAHFGLAANVETLVLQGSADLQGYGNSQANTLYGNTGNNLLNGEAGADTMLGGTGNDTYFVDNIGDQVIENLNAGTDAVFSSVDYTLAANVEALVLQGSGNLSGTGNVLANNIYGNSGNNTLNGGADADVLQGNGGDDTFVFDVGQGNGDIVLDFVGNGAAAGDSLQFAGYGGGATFTNIDATHWQVNYNGGGSHDVITFMNAAVIDVNDFAFV
jgi:Ca2+-binding RTX toxin-like protein